MADDTANSYAHTPLAEQRRKQKALILARFTWDRAITAAELLAMSPEQRRKLARAAGVAPPGSGRTWTVTANLLDTKTLWAQHHPHHPAASHPHADDKITWVKPPIQPFTTTTGADPRHHHGEAR